MKASYSTFFSVLIVITLGCAKEKVVPCGGSSKCADDGVISCGTSLSVRATSVVAKSDGHLIVDGRTSDFLNSCDCHRVESPDDDGQFGLFLSCGPTERRTCGYRGPDFSIRLMSAEVGKTFRQSPEPSYPLLEVRDVGELRDARVTFSTLGAVVSGTFEADVEGRESRVTGSFIVSRCE